VQVGGSVIMLFFSTLFFRNYEVAKIETWHLIAVWYEDDAHIIFV